MSIKYVNVSYHLESREVWDAVSFLFEKIVVTKKLNQCYEQLGCNFLERNRCQLAHSYTLWMIESDIGLFLLCVWLGIYLEHLETRLKKVATLKNSSCCFSKLFGYCSCTTILPMLIQRMLGPVVVKIFSERLVQLPQVILCLCERMQWLYWEANEVPALLNLHCCWVNFTSLHQIVYNCCILWISMGRRVMQLWN